jgi:hypothetical protein
MPAVVGITLDGCANQSPPSPSRYVRGHPGRSTRGRGDWAKAVAGYVLEAGDRPAAIPFEPAVLYMPSAAMYNAAMHDRMSPLAPRDG